MSHFLGSNFHNRRSESQEQINKIESIKRYADNDNLLKVETINMVERESVLSNSRINKYLGESFDDPDVLNYKSSNDKVVAFKETGRGYSFEKKKDIKPTSFSNIKDHQNGKDIVIEDIEQDDYSSSRQNKYQSQTKQVSSKLSECTFKADEIFNDKSEKESDKDVAVYKKSKEETKNSDKQLK